MNGSLPQWWITTCRLHSSSAIASRLISCAKIHSGRPTNPGKGEPRSRFIGEASATHPECRDSLHQSFGVPPSIGEEDPSEFPQRLEERPIGYVIAKGGETTGGCLFKAERPLPWRPSMPRNCTHLLHPTTGHTRSTRALVSAAGFLGFIMGAGGHPARFSAFLAAHPPVTPHSYGRASQARTGPTTCLHWTSKLGTSSCRPSQRGPVLVWYIERGAASLCEYWKEKPPFICCNSWNVDGGPETLRALTRNASAEIHVAFCPRPRLVIPGPKILCMWRRYVCM